MIKYLELLKVYEISCTEIFYYFLLKKGVSLIIYCLDQPGIKKWNFCFVLFKELINYLFVHTDFFLWITWFCELFWSLQFRSLILYSDFLSSQFFKYNSCQTLVISKNWSKAMSVKQIFPFSVLFVQLQKTYIIKNLTNKSKKF